RLEAGARLLHEARLAEPAPASHRHGGAERRMPREGELLVRVPDPVAGVGSLRAGRLHEGRLGEARLLGQGEHRLIPDAVRAADHGQPVAGQRAVGEDVEPGDRVVHAHIIAPEIRGPPPPLGFASGKEISNLGSETWTRSTRSPTTWTIRT